MDPKDEVWAKYGRETPMFSWNGQCVKARVVDAHDSDTCRVVFQCAPSVFKQFIIRLDGIDGPEMSSHDPQEVSGALRARNRLLSLLAPTVFDSHKDYSKKDVLRLLNEHVTLVYLELGKADKYGRVLARVYSDSEAPHRNKSVNQVLVDEGVVHAYEGKTKQPWAWSLI